MVVAATADVAARIGVRIRIWKRFGLHDIFETPTHAAIVGRIIGKAIRLKYVSRLWPHNVGQIRKKVLSGRKEVGVET